ncbi:MAG: hypothetical protein AB7G21_14325 [Dehalococcoidia bacterium]
MRRRHEVSTDRRFARQICAVFGVIFVGLGYSAAFTDVGAWLVFAGAGMLTTAALLWAPLPTVLGALAGPTFTVVLLALLWYERWR